MNLYRLQETTDGPPPEFGLTRDIIVLAKDLDHALDLSRVRKQDLVMSTLIDTSQPQVIHSLYR